MALGKRPESRQQELFLATAELARAPGHAFYERLGKLLAAAAFDRWAEDACRPFYAAGGRPGIPPGVYFRMLLIGYFEGIDSQRGIAWRCADSLSLKQFLGYGPTETTPDHSSLTKIRQRLAEEVYERMFQFVLTLVAEHKLLSAHEVGVDSTTLEANAAMKSIVRKETGEDWREYVTALMRQAGAIGPEETPSAEAVAKFDKQRKNKRVSNDDWENPHDPDAKIARMKDGRTHLAYKAEHVVDLETEVILAAEIYGANQADTATLVPSVEAAQDHLDATETGRLIGKIAADKGYHAIDTLTAVERSARRRTSPSARPSGSGATSRQRNNGPCSTIALAPSATTASGCSAGEANGSSGASPTSATRAAAGGVGCEVWKTSANITS